MMASDDGQMSHADTPPACFVDERKALQYAGVAGMTVAYFFKQAVVDFINQLQMAGQQFLHQVDAPHFQCFGHDGVVGIGKQAGREVPGRIPIPVMHIQQQAHQFRDAQAGVGVIELDGHFVGQSAQIGVMVQMALHDVLQGSADKKVLLLEAQHPAFHA